MAYVSLSDFKAWIDVSSTAGDTLAQACLDAAQSYFEEQTGRVFEAVATAAIRYRDAVADVSDNGKTLWLGKDAFSISVVVNGDGVTAASTEFVTLPRNDAPYYALQFTNSSGKTWTYSTTPENAISVSARWAYAGTCPTDVAHAVKIIAQQMFASKDNANDADRLVSADGVVIVPSSIPKIAADVIRKYTRKSFG